MLGKPIFFDPTGRRLVVFTATLVIVPRMEDKSFDQQLSVHTSIRCAWAPTCSPAHAITVSNAADPGFLKTASLGLA